MSGSPGYQALREGAAWLDLSSRGVIRVTGEDRARLLHAMSTNHIQQLQPGGGCYAFFLTAQGKIVADANVFCFDEYFLLDVEPHIRQRLYEHLDKFIIADDVVLEDLSGSVRVIGVEGPRSEEALRSSGAPVPTEPHHHQTWGEATVAQVSYTGACGYRIFAAPESLPGALPAATIEEADLVRLEHFRPLLGTDIFETTLPMETQQSHGLHFNKGCYIGQEIVERVRSRGHVNRLLAGLKLEGTAPPEKSAVISAKGVECGRITSAMYSPAEDKVVALGYMRVPNQIPGTEVEVAGMKGITVPVAGQAQTVEC
jgi:aminomethyltransferase